MSTDLNQDGRIKRLLAMTNASTGWSTLVAEILDNVLGSSTTPLGTGALAGSAASIPIGGTIEFAHDDLPANFLPCRGQTVSRTTYKALFDVVGTKYGPATADTFRLPPCTGRMIIGGDGTEDAADEDNPIFGGLAAISLSKDQIPVHAHGNGTLDIEDVEDHSHVYSAGTSGGPGVPLDSWSGQDEFNVHNPRGAASQSTGAVADHPHKIVGNSGWAGNNAPFGSYQPSLVVQMAIRAA